MVRETSLSRDDLILPLFVVEGSGLREPVASMPGVHRFSVDTVVSEAKRVVDAGVPAVIFFGIPEHKDARGSGADDPGGIVQRAVDAVKSAEPDLCLVTDVCMCEYTDHGHCGIIDEGDVVNGHDGRPRGRDPCDSRRQRIRARRDPRLRGEVRERVLRPLPRRRRERSGLW
jgi:porphobilinogen synthase